MRHMKSAATIVAGIVFFSLSSCDATGGPGAQNPTFVAENRFQVTQVSGPNDFEVFARGASAGSDFFCAAGDYARRKLGAPANARVVITHPSGPGRTNPSRRAVGFTVAPAGAVAPTGGITISARKRGANYTVSHASSLCRAGAILTISN